MTGGAETLNFYWTHLARASMALVLAGVLLGFHRHYRRGYLRSWAWSWLFLAVHLGTMAVSMALMGRFASGHPYRLLATVLSQVSGYLQLVYLLFGTAEFALDRKLSPRVQRAGLLLAIGAGLLSALLFATDPAAADLRHFLRVGLRSILAATGFILAAVAVFRRRGRTLAMGPKLVSLALLLYGLESLYDAIVSTLWLLTAHTVGGAQGWAVGYADFVVQLLMGIGMVTCLLEDERSAAERAAGQAEHLAYHDSLTELPNRQLFLDRLAVALGRARREGRKAAVFFIDLDRFNGINESLGHTVGDWVLHEAGRRIQAVVRQGDTVARFGSDEFVLLVSGIPGADEAGKIALKLLEAVQPSFQIEGRELFVTLSVGVSLFPEDGEDAEALIKNASTALHRAKDKGRDTFQLYTAAMNEKAVERLALEGALRKAVARDELVLHYQPIVSAEDGRIVGAEALLRWRHPEKGLLYPGAFIDLAESTGLITAMGPWIMKTACTQAKAWQDKGHPDLLIAMNLSARQFLDPDLVKKVSDALQASGLSASSVELEITESLAMQAPEATLETMRRLKALGVALSIDDFGSGYSSFSYLMEFPIDRLKIDQSFIRKMVSDTKNAAIVAAMLLMAKSLDLQVVAEGVEREDQLAFLREHNCAMVQGWLFSKAVEPAAFEPLLKEERLPVKAKPAAS
jgi:diguanylate cyclase (GGDEF)-like protein